MPDPPAPPTFNDPNTPQYIRDLGSYMHATTTTTQDQLTSINARLTELAGVSHQNTHAIANLQTEIRSARTTVDPCELRFSGIPSNTPLSDDDLLKIVLTAMGCAERIGPPLSVRRWVTPVGRNQQTQNQPSTSGNQPANTMALVAKFSSPTVRDFVLSKSIALKDHTSHTLFGVGGAYRIYISHVLPSTVYPIWRASLAKAKEINYLRPTIENMTVIMRADRRSAPVPILSQQELLLLPPRPQRPTPTNPQTQQSPANQINNA
ncbi:hypothetical protein QAD02_018111 [Eretmocerus hayati]|uniref:Uncharacterized protein n=1 Tax=Eretmocerus hayati TaxID=131215 RepID=A0ACC2PG93_9HYME|nr:hypothetical protein QAD02_018111 [Eretmocerus hayati]